MSSGARLATRMLLPATRSAISLAAGRLKNLESLPLVTRSSALVVLSASEPLVACTKSEPSRALTPKAGEATGPPSTSAKKSVGASPAGSTPLSENDWTRPPLR